MRKSLINPGLVLFTALLTVTPSIAQELTSGTLAGKVSDPAGNPIAGAVIIATSPSGTRTSQTDAKGEYVIPFLRPGGYSVRVEASGGFNTVIQDSVVVGLGQRTNLTFTLEPGKTETVTVTAAAPLVDIRSTATGTNLKYDDFANSVPLGRSFTDTYAVAAGVVSGGGTGKGNYSIGGASGLENSYLIDGVNITNTGYGGIGAYNISYGSLGTGVTSEFLDEVQIKSGGFEAEYGQALGGIINTIVKSGTNDLKGSVSWYATPNTFRNSTELASLDAGTSNLVGQSVNDFALSVGGPIIKNKLFYFIAYNPVMTKDLRRATSNPNPAFAAASAGVVDYNGDDPFDVAGNPNAFGVQSLAFPSSAGVLERKRTSDTYAAKFNWQLSSNHHLELTFFGDPSKGDRGAQRDLLGNDGTLYGDFSTGGGFSTIKYGSNNGTLKWNAVFGPKFFMEAQVARHVGKFRETSAENQFQFEDLRNTQEFIRGAATYDDPVNGPTPFALTPVAPFQGGVGYLTSQDDKSTVYQVKLTTVLGKHELKYGLEYDDISYTDTASDSGPSFTINFPLIDPATGDPLDADNDGVQDTHPITSRGGAQVQVRNTATGDLPGQGSVTIAYDTPNVYRVVRAFLSPIKPPTTATERNGFIQDTWSISPRWTIKAGVRVTQETIEGSGQFSLATNSLAPTDYTPSSYTFAANIAPRLGVVWDLLGNGKSRAYFNFGRYFERVPNDLAVRAFSNEVTISKAEYSDRTLSTPLGGGASKTCSDGLGGTNTCTTAPAVVSQGIQPSDVVAGVKLPYEDEISGGYAFEVTPHSSVEVRAIFRTQGRVLEDTQVNSVEAIQNYYYGTSYGFPFDPFGGSKTTPNSPSFPATPFGPYLLANPGTRQIPPGLQSGTTFPNPTRSYKALEMIYTKRFSDSWSLYANYRFARLNGNYEGLFRNDNGQSDPNITSLYDFPSSPLMSGQFIKGALPTDRSHTLHVYPSYQFQNKLRVGANFSWTSGFPRTSLLAHPIYQNFGEIPGINPVYAYWQDPTPGDNDCGDCVLKRTSSLAAALADPDSASSPFLFSYTPAHRGNLGRSPDLANLDLHADYPIATGNGSSLRLMLDVFNVLQLQEPTLFDDNIELTAGVTDPDFLKPIAFQSPRTWRLAARWEF